MRSIKARHRAVYSPMEGLITYRAMPTRTIQHLDPFLFLNHHGPQLYPPNNNGLPFGPHPHRGFETLTFVVNGDIVHRDSSGSDSTIDQGGVQWMTAGSGLIHSEISSSTFKEKGGEVEVLQLWMNLPSKHKMTSPFYIGLQEDKIPHLGKDNGRVVINLISGSWGVQRGPIDSLTQLMMSSIDMKPMGQWTLKVAVAKTILFYIVKGKVIVNGQTARMHELVEFNHDNEGIVVEALEHSLLIFGYGEPLKEPIVAQGPFVMNTEQEITQAFKDYQSGKFGVWKE